MLPPEKTEAFEDILQEGSFEKFNTFLKTLDPKIENSIAKYINEEDL